MDGVVKEDDILGVNVTRLHDPVLPFYRLLVSNILQMLNKLKIGDL